jgi:hypothetical protein
MNPFERHPFRDDIKPYISENIVQLRNLINAQYMLRNAKNDFYIGEKQLPTFCTKEIIENALDLIDNE